MKAPIAIAVAQFDCIVGDLAANADRVLNALQQARERGARVLLTPELALSGYPPEDLLLRPAFHQACEKELARIVAATREAAGVALVLGHPQLRDGVCYNAASVIREGRVEACYFKQRLPNHSVFDELRYFQAGNESCVFEVDGLRLGLAICEDLWDPAPARAAREAGAQLLLGLNASPFHVGKSALRREAVQARVAESGLPVLYCNAVGGQDELVFDGASFALDADGRPSWRAASFVEQLEVLRLEDGRWSFDGVLPAEPEPEEEAYTALVVGVRDYVRKNGFPGAILGLSGGIDSALALCVAVDALGAERVHALMLPSPYTAQMSLDDAREMARRTGVRYDEIAIGPAMEVFDAMLAEQFQGRPADTTEENLQSRIRGVLLMALSNKTGAIVLTAGNKSEAATGYSTLYGDMAGGLAVLKDVYKCLVYRLARWRNLDGAPIPENIIVRPPSAELKPDQLDQDSLPPYEVLDAIVEAYMERDESPAEIIARGYAEEDVRRVVHLLRINEYKRRQAPVGIRITRRAFGKDWRYPITSRYRDEF